MSSFRRTKITENVVATLAPGETVMDVEEPGFGVRRQGAARVFFVRKHARGVRHYQTIGPYGSGVLTVSIARDTAKRLVISFRDGASPADRRARDRSMPTVQALAEEWMDFHVRAKLKKGTVALYRSILAAHVVPALGSTKVDALTEDQIAGLHYAMRKIPYAANRMVAVVRKMMGFAERRGYRPRNSNPAKGIERYREEKRERFLTYEELTRIGTALADPQIEARHSPFAVQALIFLLLTGARLREALHLKWHEVDLERGLVFLGDSKTGKRAIILGRSAVELLRRAPQTGSPFVFPGVKRDQPMYDVRKTWLSVTQKAQLNGVRIHDLRHTFASISAGAGGSLPMIGHLLGHSQGATTERYIHLAAATPVRQLADQVSIKIASALNVVPSLDGSRSVRRRTDANGSHATGMPDGGAQLEGAAGGATTETSSSRNRAKR